jgi:hypothetical protein
MAIIIAAVITTVKQRRQVPASARFMRTGCADV